MPEAKRYSDQEVREILERALQGDERAGGAMTHADLLAIGEQVGVAPEVMARAAEEVVRANADAAIGDVIKSGRRKWLALHAAAFALLNGLFFGVNYLTTPGEWWFLFSVFFWGLGLAAHAGVALGVGVSARAIERERRKLHARKPQPRLRIEGAADASPTAEAEETDGVVDGLASSARARK